LGSQLASPATGRQHGTSAAVMLRGGAGGIGSYVTSVGAPEIHGTARRQARRAPIRCLPTAGSRCTSARGKRRLLVSVGLESGSRVAPLEDARVHQIEQRRARVQRYRRDCRTDAELDLARSGGRLAGPDMDKDLGNPQIELADPFLDRDRDLVSLDDGQHRVDMDVEIDADMAGLAPRAH